MMFELENMKGKTLHSVRLENDKEKVVFEFADESFQEFGVEGDCCSQSWIEHLEMPNDVKGATILDVVENNGVENDPEVLKNHDCLAVYQTRFITERGEIVLEYRNDSNGYYGGYLVAL